MKTKIIINICATIFLFNCCSQKKDVADTLSANCFWDILNIASPHPINSCYKFSKTGDCNFYYYHHYAKKRLNTVYVFNDIDIIVSNKWKMLKDSIQIRANKYYIIRYNSDSVFLTATGTDTMVLIKNCATFNPKEK